MEIKDASYITDGNGLVSATVNGSQTFIPASNGNSLWIKINKLVDAGELVIAPYVAPVVPPRRVGSPREFLHLFTDAEKVAFFTAVSSSMEMALWWAEASTGDFSLDHPSVAAGLATLVGAGILSEDRVDEILGADFNAS